ncbi:DUF551 domain-containing protein [Acinetobacter lwoffii]|uniref:DUF551 domain-containing protein n=1 Tax=Acinetobacter lwoffii TaxID=28090 RepID=UPI00300A59C1
MTITLQDTEILDNEISQLENAFIDRHFLTDSEAGELETLIAKAMKLGEMYALQKAQAEQWISVEDQLPEEGQRVIVYGDYGCGESSMIEAFNHYLYKRQGITHWMPRPIGPIKKPSCAVEDKA